MSKQKRKAKFRIGQVVRFGREYFLIRERMFVTLDSPSGGLPGWQYREEWSWHPEVDLRPLTEKGEARRGKT